MLTRDQVFAISDKYGAFEFGDAQGDKRQAFAADLIAAHQRMRDAAPELLAFVAEYLQAWEDGMAGDSYLRRLAEQVHAKATGGAL